MSVEQQLPADHPLMKAWTAFQASPEYANAVSWAAYEQHAPGSLWAAFVAGWRVAHPPGAQERKVPVLASQFTAHPLLSRLTEEARKAVAAAGPEDGRIVAMEREPERPRLVQLVRAEEKPGIAEPGLFGLGTDGSFWWRGDYVGIWARLSLPPGFAGAEADAREAAEAAHG